MTNLDKHDQQIKFDLNIKLLFLSNLNLRTNVIEHEYKTLEIFLTE